nr:uncharacterized protein LOC106689234 isoform X2 [Halyomorpha halys]
MTRLLALSLVGCWGIRWKAMNDFKKSFHGYSIASAKTISHIQNILDISRRHLKLFFNDTYSNNPVVKKIRRMKSSNDKCFAKFIDNDHFKFVFENQIYQLQIPVKRRLIDVREKLNKINSSIEIYESVANSIFRSCKLLHENCSAETNEWLTSIIHSLSCVIHPDCQIINNNTNHSIRKRTICHPRQFKCQYGKCTSGTFFCDGECDCADCSDEPDGCLKDCNGFRCSETFRCISNSKMCNGVDDCGDGADEEGCRKDMRTINDTWSEQKETCSIDAGEFLCKNKNCISLQKICDSHDDCGDWSEEGAHCSVGQCSLECVSEGGICLFGLDGSKCVYKCPSGTYERSTGCSVTKEAPFTTLVQFLQDTPRLTKRYIGRVKLLKLKTTKMINKSLKEVEKCKKQRFRLFPHRPITNGVLQHGNILIDDEYMPGRISAEYGNGKNKPGIRSTNNKLTNINQPSYEMVDDENMPERVSEENGNGKNKRGIRPTNNKPTNINQPSYEIVDDENMPGRVSEEYGNGKNKRRIIPTNNKPTNINQPSYEMVDDENMPERVSEENGNGKNKCGIRPMNNKPTNINQPPYDSLDNENMPGRLPVPSSSTIEESSSKTNPANTEHETIRIQNQIHNPVQPLMNPKQILLIQNPKAIRI